MRIGLIAVWCLLSLVLAQLRDVPESHWAGEAVAELTELGVLTGFPDGTFRGDSNITRYEAALMIYRVLSTFDPNFESSTQPDIENLLLELEVLQDAVFGNLGEDGNFDLMLLNDALDQVDALSARIDTLEQSVPAATALFDDLRRNLVQLEQGFTNGTLSVKEDVLTELDLRFTEFRTAVEESFVTYVDGQLNEYDASVSAKLADLSSRLTAEEETSRAEISRLEKENLQLEGRLQEEMEDLEGRLIMSQLGGAVVVGAGFEGETPIYTVALKLYRGDAELTGELDDGDLDLASRYDFSSFAVGARYEFRVNAAQALGAVQASAAFDPLALTAEVGYSDELEFGVRIAHDGSLPSAAVRGLDASVAARLKLGEESTNLINAQAQLALPLGNLTAVPGVLYRRVSDEYQGFMGSLTLNYDVSDDVTLFADGRYGLFSAPGEEGSRGVPEAALGIIYKDVSVSGFLDAGLPEYEAYPSFLDTNPAIGQDLNIGLQARVTIGFP